MIVIVRVVGACFARAILRILLRSRWARARDLGWDWNGVRDTLRNVDRYLEHFVGGVFVRVWWRVEDEMAVSYVMSPEGEVTRTLCDTVEARQ